jgi:predicted secreted protein
MRLRPAAVALCLIAVIALGPAALAASAVTAPGVTAPSVTALSDTIAPGVIKGVDGFGTASVLVPKGTYITYLARTDSRLKGKLLQIWTNTGAGWHLTTTRRIAADGTVHYFARVTERSGYWAKYAGDSSHPAASGHGRSATVSADGTTVIAAQCADFAPADSGAKVILSRTVAAPVGATIRVTVCANPSTGFSWTSAAYDAAHLTRVGHSLHPGGPPPGSPGTETWSYRVVESGMGRATLVYSQPWKGGLKAAWTVMLTVDGHR